MESSTSFTPFPSLPIYPLGFKQCGWMNSAECCAWGGHLLLSTHGEHQLHGLTDEEKAMFHNGQLVVKRPNSAGSNYCVSYHPESYVRDYLARGFNVIDFVPQGATGTAHQDLYLLRRSPDTTDMPRGCR